VLTGGAGNDIFHLGSGGDDTVQGGAGNDVIYGEAGYSSGDTIDGGTGTNNFWLGGKDYTGASAVTFTAANFLNIQTIDLNSSHSYSLTMNDANVAAGATMEVDGHLAASFTFDGSAETDGHFTIVASTGADVLAGGALSDTFVFDAVNYSTGTTYDAITNLNFSSDILELNAGSYVPTAIDAAITTGALSTATFNSDLATAVNSSTLAADHAVLFTATSGTLSGHTFLVVDHNGVAGYQASADYVIDVTGYSGALTTGSFT
jgi:Ca2+-binding RTX toxin-like protein